MLGHVLIRAQVVGGTGVITPPSAPSATIPTRAPCFLNVVEVSGERNTCRDVLARSQAGGVAGAITPTSAPSAAIATQASCLLNVVEAAGEKEDAVGI